MYICPYCGNFLEKESRFCGKCGNQFHPKICPKCKYQSYFNDYCVNCGEKLEFLELYLHNLDCSATQLGFDDKYDDALNIYEELLQFKPNSKASCLHSLGKYEEAIECYDKIINMDLDNDITWKGKGMCLADLNKLDEALKCINKSLELNPNYNFTLFQKADILFKLHKYVEIKNVLSEIKPDDYIGWFMLYDNYFKIQEYDKALDCTDEMLSLNYGYSPLFIKGKIYFELKEYDEAIKFCQQASEFYSGDELNDLINKINMAQKNSKSGD